MRGRTYFDPECSGSSRRNCAVLVEDARMGIASALTITPAMAAGITNEIFLSDVQTHSPGGDDTPQFLDKDHSVFVFIHAALINFSSRHFDGRGDVR